MVVMVGMVRGWDRFGENRHMSEAAGQRSLDAFHGLGGQAFAVLGTGGRRKGG